MRKVIKPITIAILLCLVLLLIKNQFFCLLMKNSAYGMPALIEKGGTSNLYLGSSMFRQGLDIDALDNASGSDNYILAYNGNQPATEYYELKYLLDHDVQIENLYVDMYVYSAWEAPEINDEKLFLEIGISEKLNLWKLIKTDSVSNNLKAFWRMWVSSNNELILTWPVSSAVINSQFRNGGALTKTSSASKEALDASDTPSIASQINATQEYYIRALINLAKENHINIIFIETPKYSTVSNYDSYLNAMEVYTKILDKESVSYVLAENTYEKISTNSIPMVYSFDLTNHEFYMDAIHLSSEGRFAFSNYLKSILQ